MQPQESTDRVTGQPNWTLDLQYFWGDNGTQTTNNNGNLRGKLIQTWNGANFSSANNYWETFSYDGVNRLQAMTDNGGGANERDFAYDAFGNMWVSGNAGFNASGTMPVANIYNGANRLNNTNYDAAGNQLAINGSTVSYDAENRTAQPTEPASLGRAQMTYVYDGEGRRVEKLVNGAASTVYVYDAQGQLAAEYAASATAAALCQTYYLITDHLGSTRMVTDAAGHVVARHDYLPLAKRSSLPPGAPRSGALPMPSLKSLPVKNVIPNPDWTTSEHGTTAVRWAGLPARIPTRPPYFIS